MESRLGYGMVGRIPFVRTKRRGDSNRVITSHHRDMTRRGEDLNRPIDNVIKDYVETDIMRMFISVRASSILERNVLWKCVKAKTNLRTNLTSY